MSGIQCPDEDDVAITVPEISKSLFFKQIAKQSFNANNHGGNNFPM